MMMMTMTNNNNQEMNHDEEDISIRISSPYTQGFDGSVPVCPRGFDCALINSCPAFYLPCPPGFFCSSYQGFDDEGLMDYRYGKYAYGDVVTESNKEQYIDPDRAIQCKCLLGFYCPNSTTMYSCPSDHWCSESTVVPFECDPLSMCDSDAAAYQINFINILIGAMMSFAVLVLSYVYIQRQKRKNEKSRKIDTESEKSKLKNSKKEKQTNASIEISFRDIEFRFPSSSKQILPGISGTIPAAEISLVLGPSSSGKTTLLQVIRSGGLYASSGRVQYNLVGDDVATLNPLGGGGSYNSGSLSRRSLNNDGSPLPAASSAATITLIEENDDVAADSLLENEISFATHNKRRLHRSELSKYVGYVPQEDILDRQLTVRELLLFHARTRLANQQIFDGSMIEEIVMNVMIDLNILHIADAIIGGNENAAANISGGQLKRVNIACELVSLSSPSVLLLDEPTSGLDANIAFELIESLNNLRIMKNITIFMVLQQPRYEIFQLMNHLFLMGPSGNIVYEGMITNVSNQLISLGFHPYSIETSDADFCIDVLNQMKYENEIKIIEKELDENEENPLFHRHHSYQNRGSSFLIDSELLLEDQLINLFTGKSSNNYENNQSSSRFSWYCCCCCGSIIENIIKTIFDPIFYLFIYYNMKRLMKIRLRNSVQLVVYIFLNVLMAIALASGFSIFMNDSYLSVLNPPESSLLKNYYPSSLNHMKLHNIDQYSLTQLLFFLCASLGCASCLTAVPVFAGNRNIALREKSSGICIISYGIGRMIGDLPFVFMTSMVFAGVWCCFGMAGSYHHWMGTIFFTAYAASGIGYVAGVSSSGYNANVYAIIMTFICCVFSGSEPSLTQVSKYPIVNWPWYLSFGTWTSEATYVTWSDYLTNNGNIPNNLQTGADSYGYQVTDGLARSLLSLFAIGTGLRLIVLFVLYKL